MHESHDPLWLRRLLTAVVVLLAVIAVELAFLVPAGPRPAYAALPDAGRQRQDLLEATRQTNATLERILHHLRTQTIKVKSTSTDKEEGKSPAGNTLPAAK